MLHLCVSIFLSSLIREALIIITGRQRKVKCGEEKPSCRNCSSHSRHCVWPNSRDLCDRRNELRGGRRPSASSKDDTPSVKPHEPSEEVVIQHTHASLIPSLGTGSSAICSEAEFELFQHFLNDFSPLVVLPTWNKSSFQEYRYQVACMMMHFRSVKFAVLSSCAMNKYMRSRNYQYQTVALMYYSRAVEEVKQEVVRLQLDQTLPEISLITAVIYLYIYDVCSPLPSLGPFRHSIHSELMNQQLWGEDALVDPRKHVAGAMKLLNLRSGGGSSQLSMSRALDRVTAESVVYQAFLLSMRRPFTPYFPVDVQFMDRAESILNSERLMAAIHVDSSPVLGIPLSLYRFILDIIHFRNSTEQPSVALLARLRTEMEYWETFVLTGSTTSHSLSTDGGFSTDMIILYVLATSLLLDWITESSTSGLSTNALQPPDVIDLMRGNVGLIPWQLSHGLKILRRPNTSTAWSHGFLGPWPILIFGYAVTAEEDIALLRTLLREIVYRLGYGEVQRMLDELEEIWGARKCDLI